MPEREETGPANQLRVYLLDRLLKEDQRLLRTPVEIVRQATTEAGLGSPDHLYDMIANRRLEIRAGSPNAVRRGT
jgi:hypothetical protein